MYRLAAELRRIGLHELAERAENGYYASGVLSPIEEPSWQLEAELKVVGTTEALALCERNLDGEFEASEEEDRAWVVSPEGRRAFLWQRDKPAQLNINEDTITAADDDSSLRGRRSIWTVFDHYPGFPDLFEARLTEVDGDLPVPVTSDFYVIAGDLDTIRESFQRCGLTCRPRETTDDPSIIETWSPAMAPT
jgi:hypothetical protein